MLNTLDLSGNFKVSGTIALTTGQINVTGAVQIHGTGAAKLSISGNNLSRILEITTPVEVSISGVTFTKGNPGLSFGGAIYNKGALALFDDVFYENVSASYAISSGGGGGGAIYNPGTLYASDCTFDDNSDYAHDGNTSGANSNGVDGGGAIYNKGSATITRNTFSNNSAQLSPRGVDPIGNGGAIYNAGSLLLTDSTVYGNSANAPENFAAFGGGIYNQAQASATLVNCTVADNSADQGGGIGGDFGSTLKIGNSIVANNPIGGDVVAPLTSLGNNLIGNSDGFLANFLPSDIVGTWTSPINPDLGPLAKNGGPTETLSIPGFSPARATGSVALANHYGLTVDQRGLPRIEFGTVDIGACEAPVDQTVFQ